MAYRLHVDELLPASRNLMTLVLMVLVEGLITACLSVSPCSKRGHLVLVSVVCVIVCFTHRGVIVCLSTVSRPCAAKESGLLGKSMNMAADKKCGTYKARCSFVKASWNVHLQPPEKQLFWIILWLLLIFFFLLYGINMCQICTVYVKYNRELPSSFSLIVEKCPYT